MKPPQPKGITGASAADDVLLSFKEGTARPLLALSDFITQTNPISNVTQ